MGKIISKHLSEHGRKEFDRIFKKKQLYSYGSDILGGEWIKAVHKAHEKLKNNPSILQGESK